MKTLAKRFHLSTMLLAFTFMGTAVFTSCGSHSNDQAAQRLAKVLEIRDNIAVLEKSFMGKLDSLNVSRSDSSYTQAGLEQDVAGVTASYNAYVQSLYDGLGKSAALANAETCPSVDALSEFLLGMKVLAETRYSEMMRLSALPLETYSDADSSAYTLAVEKAEEERDNLERPLQFELQRFAKEHKIELEEME